LLDCLAGKTTLVDRILAAADVLPRADIDWLHDGQDRQALFLDQPGYPPQLAQIADPPLALLVEGDARLLLAPQIAIVGSRNASPAGRETAFSMASALAQCGLR
jgi:Predicted Rossmann fold nucleotide-binding protein involved in DNA uptake